MNEPNKHRAADWFTPVRFGILLALFVFAAFPQVILGVESFVARDFGFFAYPLAHFQQQCFWRGELPFWNPYNDCGVPFLAQWNTMPLYPPALVYLTLPLEWSLSFFCLLHLWFAGLGMYFLSRRWTGNNFAASFAGTAFAFNGFTLNLLMWPSHIATFSWMPWVVLAAELAWRDGGKKIILAAFAGAMQMLAGGPETIFLTWLIASALWLQQFISGRAASSPPQLAVLWRFPLVVALVISLTLAQLLPFLDLVAHSQRETGYADLRWSMPGFGIANFLVPMAFGSTQTEGIFLQNGQLWTSSYYLGIGTLWLALLALWVKPDSVGTRARNRLLIFMVAVGLILALGENTPVLPALRKLIPQLSFITYPIKYISAAVFAMPLLAAVALVNRRRLQKQTALLGVILLLCMAAILFSAWRFPFPGDDVSATLLNGCSRAVFLILTGGLLFVLTRGTGTRLHRVAPLFLILVAWLDVFTHEPAQNPTVPASVYEPNLARTKLAMQPQPELGQSRAMLSSVAYGQLMMFSVQNPKNNFLAKRLGYCGNANLLDGVPKVDGFFSLYPREIGNLLERLYSFTDVDFPHLDNFLGVSQIIAPGELFKWQARTNHLPLVTAGQKLVFLDDEKALPALTQKDFDGGKIIFLPPAEKSSVTVSNQSDAKILNSKFGIQTMEAEVETAAPSLVVVAQTYYHNWRAEVDGQPVSLLRANVAFQAVQVPAGTHKIHLFYQDRAFEIGAAISLCMWVNCFVAYLVLPRRELPASPALDDDDDYL